MKTSEIVGYRMKQWRTHYGLTQTEVGGQLGDLLGKSWPAQAVSSAEHGRREFTAEEILAIAVVFKAPAGGFFVPPLEEETIDFPARTVPRQYHVIHDEAMAATYAKDVREAKELLERYVALLEGQGDREEEV